MTKYFKIVFIVVIFVIVAGSLWHFSSRLDSSLVQVEEQAEPLTATGASEEIEPEESQVGEQEEAIAENQDKKYDALKKNELYKRNIEKGDYYFSQNRLISAIKKFQSAKKIKSINDPSLDIKIGDVYYELKNYKQAYQYYKGNDSVEGFSKQKELDSLFYSYHEFTEDDLEDLKGEFAEMTMNEADRVYYINSLQCVLDFSKCKQFYQDYFVQKSEEGIEHERLLKLKEGFDAYEGSGTDDLSFKNAIVIGKFYENNHYPVVIKLSKDMLEEHPGYGPVIKMLGKSYYELGKFDEAHEILKPYHEKNLSDEKVAYFLGMINMRRKFFLASSVYYNKALLAGYEPEIEVKRKLVYNYFLIENNEKMYSMLDDLLYDEGVSDSDFSLAIYQALLDEKYELALEYAKRGSVNFPESATFYGYIADIHMKMGNKKLAIEAVEDGKRIDPKDISIVFHEGKMYMDQGNYSKAFLSFRRVISLSKGKGDYVDQANAELEIIKNERNK